MNVKVAEIVIENTEYVAYYYNKEVSKGKSITKVSQKLAKYIQGQS